MFTVSETVAVLERPAGQTRQKYEYRFLTANREDTMQKALEASVSEGFHPEAMSVNRDISISARDNKQSGAAFPVIIQPGNQGVGVKFCRAAHSAGSRPDAAINSMEA